MPGRQQRAVIPVQGVPARLLVSHSVHLQKTHQSLAADVFSRIANKSPVRGTGGGVRLKSTKAYYPIVDFIYSRCRACSGVTGRMLTGPAAPATSSWSGTGRAAR